jgi:hypothetical protein
MTINHLNLMVSLGKMPAMRAFYASVLKPLGYKELIFVNDSWIGYGSDYPYLWLKAVADDTPVARTHIAIDAPGSLTTPNNDSLENILYLVCKVLI